MVRSDGVTWPPQTWPPQLRIPWQSIPLLLLGALEAWLNFEGYRRRGWVCPRVGDLPDHRHPPARTSCRSNLANHILVFFCHSHARSGPQTLAPLWRQQRTTQINGYLVHRIFHTPDRCFSRMYHSRSVSSHPHPIYIITRDPTDHPR